MIQPKIAFLTAKHAIKKYLKFKEKKQEISAFKKAQTEWARERTELYHQIAALKYSLHIKNQSPVIPEQEKIQRIARLAAVFLELHGKSSVPENIDYWEVLAPEQKALLIQGVQAIIRFPDLNPEQMHGLTQDMYYQLGWRHGDHFDPDNKIRPFVPYEQQPCSVKYSDSLFHFAVHQGNKILNGKI